MFISLFSTLGGLATLNVAITEFIKSKITINSKIGKQILSWLIPMIISVFGLVFGLGLFADFGTISQVSAWVYTLLTGFGLGLASNGIYEITYVQKIIDAVKELFSKAKLNS